MIARARGYYGAPFKGLLTVTHGDPLSTTIFNMVVDAILCHCVTVVVALDEADPLGAART